MTRLACIYCNAHTGPFTGKAHAFPEALIANDLALPPGVVCDPCNAYLGANVDSALLEHPFVAMAVQLLALPGKRGKPRQRLGKVDRNPVGGWITFPIEEPRQNPDGSRTISPIVDAAFKMPLFSRALHHIAFNILVLQTSHNFALRPQFDPLRHYVRAPAKGELRPFVILSADMTDIRLTLAAGREPHGPGETVGIRLFNFDIFLDLLNRGGLLHWAQQHLDEPFHYIDASWEPPPPIQPGQRRFRARVEPPEGYLP